MQKITISVITKYMHQYLPQAPAHDSRQATTEFATEQIREKSWRQVHVLFSAITLQCMCTAERHEQTPATPLAIK